MGEPLLNFNDRERLIDAVMLAGAGLSPCNVGSRLVTLSCSRMRSQRRELGWLILLLQVHGIRLSLVNDGTVLEESDKLTYKSRGDRFLYPALLRWYPEFESAGVRQAVTPETIELDTPMLVVWLADALSQSRANSPVRLSGPRMSRQAAERMSWYVTQHGYSNHVVRTSSFWGLSIAPDQRPELEVWLAKYVPRSIWATSEEAMSGQR
jgi:hypothetical protein